eukprot:3526838-Amphidinium_carterae.1
MSGHVPQQSPLAFSSPLHKNVPHFRKQPLATTIHLERVSAVHAGKMHDEVGIAVWQLGYREYFRQPPPLPKAYYSLD